MAELAASGPLLLALLEDTGQDGAVSAGLPLAFSVDAGLGAAASTDLPFAFSAGTGRDEDALDTTSAIASAAAAPC